jgi:hypothetical protein
VHRGFAYSLKNCGNVERGVGPSLSPCAQAHGAIYDSRHLPAFLSSYMHRVNLECSSRTFQDMFVLVFDHPDVKADVIPLNTSSDVLMCIGH